MHRGGVDDVELGPVDEHQPDRVAAAHAEAVQAGGERLDALERLGVGQRRAVVGGAQRDLVGALGGGGQERLAQRAGAEGSGHARDLISPRSPAGIPR